MQGDNVIEVNNVYKKFKNYFDKSHSLKERFLSRTRNEYEEYWVLKGIDFQVKRGEAVGLIGCNGCGKSTTLKLLTKIIYPDKGKIEVCGRVSSLLELGAGFHPDLSGYENIYLNAAVFGLTRREIDQRVDEIIRFSELREFINNPIRTYSSGMYMKLAFSVAINVDADILLIDEILGVGDVNFQKKCFEKLVSIRKKGTTIVIVSHSMDQIEKICDRSIWIDKGTVVAEGEPKQIHALYMEKMAEKQIIQQEKEEKERMEDERRKEERNKARDIRHKDQMEKMKEEVSEHREQERKALELRRKERQRLHAERRGGIADCGEEYSEKLKQQEAEEIEKQKSFLKKAAEVREKRNEAQNTPKRELATKMEMRVEFYKKEAERLELVVQEKEAELERLNSVIRQKNIEIEKNHSEFQKEISRLERALDEKEEEQERLNDVILEKNIEIDRVNLVILQKDYEISRLLEE